MLCMHTFADIIEPLAIDKDMFIREIAISIATYNIRAVVEKFYTNGVIAFVCTAYMLAFHRCRFMCVCTRYVL